MFLFKLFNSSFVQEWLDKTDLPNWGVNTIAVAIDLAVLAIIAFIADFIARRIFLTIMKRLVLKSKTKWDDYFYEQKVFKSLAHLFPAIIVHLSIDEVLADYPTIFPALQKAVEIYIIVLIVVVINKALKAFENLMVNDEKYANSPLRTVSQVVRILMFFVALVFIVSILTGIKAGSIIGVLAGTSAILILIFQDTINGVLANLQITMYDLVRVGDWVTLEKYGADGDVMSIDLTTVKIRNFDKTISSVPAKAFVNDSFVNWRGMKEAMSRRIKRNIIIDISSIRFCTAEDIENFSQIGLISEYVKTRQGEIEQDNKKKNLSEPLKLNGRAQSNIGVYKRYIANYLESHPNIDSSFTMLVRQLQPTAQGVPIEVYCFANTTNWNKYESIQDDIFDHLYVATSHFGLQLYQAPAGADLKNLTLKTD